MLAQPPRTRKRPFYPATSLRAPETQDHTLAPADPALRGRGAGAAQDPRRTGVLSDGARSGPRTRCAGRRAVDPRGSAATPRGGSPAGSPSRAGRRTPRPCRGSSPPRRQGPRSSIGLSAHSSTSSRSARHPSPSSSSPGESTTRHPRSASTRKQLSYTFVWLLRSGTPRLYYTRRVCTRTGLYTGIDTCIDGAMCRDRDTSDDIGTCVAHCTGSFDEIMCERGTKGPCRINLFITSGGDGPCEARTSFRGVNWASNSRTSPNRFTIGFGAGCLCLPDCNPLLQDCADPPRRRSFLPLPSFRGPGCRCRCCRRRRSFRSIRLSRSPRYRSGRPHRRCDSWVVVDA